MIVNTREKVACVLAVFCLVYCTVSSAVEKPSEVRWRRSSNANLVHISFLLVRTKDQPIEELVASDDAQEKGVEIASAERVFLSAMKEASMPEDLLVHAAYARAVKPENPGAQTVTGKWGSSYSTWCMSAGKWKLAKEFCWYHDIRDLVLPFPILWDKKPELCGGSVPILAINGTTYSLPVRKLDSYLRAASQWVEPKSQPVEEVLQMLRSDAVEKRITAVRLLGARKDARNIPSIVQCFSDQRMEVRRDAAWALGMVAGPAAVAHLHANIEDRSSGVRREIASALGAIGGSASLEPLAELLKDRDPDVRKTAAAAMAATGSEKAVPHLVQALGDEDKATRQTALESLIKLGWQPPKQSNESPQR